MFGEKMKKMKYIYKEITPKIIDTKCWSLVEKSWSFLSQGKVQNIEFKCSTFRTVLTFTRTRISIDFHLWTFEDDYELFSISGILSRLYDSNSTLRNEIDNITKDGFISYES